VNVFLTQASFDGDRNVRLNVAIAGVQINVGGKITRQFQIDAAVPGVKGPARSDRRPGQSPRFNAAVSSGQIERVESSIRCNVAIAGARPQHAIHGLNVLMAVAGLQVHLAF
jgi:hypothetical protein